MASFSSAVATGDAKVAGLKMSEWLRQMAESGTVHRSGQTQHRASRLRSADEHSVAFPYTVQTANGPARAIVYINAHASVIQVCSTAPAGHSVDDVKPQTEVDGVVEQKLFRLCDAVRPARAVHVGDLFFTRLKPSHFPRAAYGADPPLFDGRFVSMGYNEQGHPILPDREIWTDASVPQVFALTGFALYAAKRPPVPDPQPKSQRLMRTPHMFQPDDALTFGLRVDNMWCPTMPAAAISTLARAWAELDSKERDVSHKHVLQTAFCMPDTFNDIATPTPIRYPVSADAIGGATPVVRLTYDGTCGPHYHLVSHILVPSAKLALKWHLTVGTAPESASFQRLSVDTVSIMRKRFAPSLSFRIQPA